MPPSARGSGKCIDNALLNSYLLPMFLARVIGTLWATRKDESLEGSKMQILQPLDRFSKPKGSPLIALDTIGAGPGETVFYITAREATIPLRHGLSPVDASIVGIVDTIENY